MRRSRCICPRNHRVEEAVDVGAFRFVVLSEESVKIVCEANGPQDRLLSDACEMVRGVGFEPTKAYATGSLIPRRILSVARLGVVVLPL